MSTPVEPDASTGAAGAPPREHEPNRAQAGLTREYSRPEIRIEWYASRCIHAAACIRRLPTAFNPEHRPWIDVGAADPDALAAAVVRCPTGALQYERLDGGPQEEQSDTVQVTPVRNGPYVVRGPVELMNPVTRQMERETRVALCRCGQSKHMPRCDNTHRAIGFRSQP
ncbi:MAG TPA: (4Fe-4S)-binding protein [Gemmatimonadaceae bacterium]|nr:(4Fe-4S)-binding protein [Gemmatimonadaceae bacterium]